MDNSYSYWLDKTCFEFFHLSCAAPETSFYDLVGFNLVKSLIISSQPWGRVASDSIPSWSLPFSLRMIIIIVIIIFIFSIIIMNTSFFENNNHHHHYYQQHLHQLDAPVHFAHLGQPDQHQSHLKLLQLPQVQYCRGWISVDYIRWFFELPKKRNSNCKIKCQWIKDGSLNWKKSILTERLLSLSQAWQPQGAPMGTWFKGNLIYDALHLFEKEESVAV